LARRYYAGSPLFPPQWAIRVEIDDDLIFFMVRIDGKYRESTCGGAGENL